MSILLLLLFFLLFVSFYLSLFSPSFFARLWGRTFWQWTWTRGFETRFTAWRLRKITRLNTYLAFVFSMALFILVTLLLRLFSFRMYTDRFGRLTQNCLLLHCAFSLLVTGWLLISFTLRIQLFLRILVRLLSIKWLTLLKIVSLEILIMSISILWLR